MGESEDPGLGSPARSVFFAPARVRAHLWTTCEATSTAKAMSSSFFVEQIRCGPPHRTMGQGWAIFTAAA